MFSGYLSMSEQQKQLIFEYFKTDILPTSLTNTLSYFLKDKEKGGVCGGADSRNKR